MPATLWEGLAEFYNISLEHCSGAVASLGGTDLYDREAMANFLNLYNRRIEGIDTTVAAAYFSSWFGDIAAALHYAVSVHHAAPDFSAEKLMVHLIPETGYTRLGFQLTLAELEQAPRDAAERAAWRETVFIGFYSRTVRPLIECLAEASGLNAGLLWGQLPTALQNHRERFHAAFKENQLALQQYGEDEHFVRNGLDAEWFGRSRNPLRVKVRWIDHPLEEGKRLAIKNVCCMQYLRHGRSYCYTCPRISQQERSEWQW